MERNIPNQQQQAPPNNHLALAIITTILCCLPAGIVSIVYATQVNSKWQAGDYQGAQRASKNAQTWWIVAIVAASISVILFIVFSSVFFSYIGMEDIQRELPQN